MEFSSCNNDTLFNNLDLNSMWINDITNFDFKHESPKSSNEFEKAGYEYIDEQALQMMSDMGFNKGELLNQNNQESVDLIDESKSVNQELEHVVKTNVVWDPKQEIIEAEEVVNWLNSCTNESKNCKYIDDYNLSDWIKIVPKKLTISDETKYCDAVLLQKVLKAKEVFDELDLIELCKARSKANPFETIKSAFFLNRAALKMANIDAVTGFLFTNVDRQVEHKQSDHPYYFADICAGPGGFSEYVLWRKKWAFKGFGMTLRGEHDFKLYDSTCAPYETFEAYYGVLDNGDIYYPANIEQFCSHVKLQTKNDGVHFVMADGGFSVEGQENIQEVLSKRLYVCQCYTALNALRPSGHFVVKMFDLFTPFSVGLLFLMHHCFQRVAIVKPNSSRPANSERYLVCSKLKNDRLTEKIRKYMKTVVQILWDLQNDSATENLDLYELVPCAIIQEHKTFCKFVTDSNNRLAEKQVIGLLKLAAFCRDPSLIESRQEELRSQCLRYWQIPDRAKIPLPHLTIDDLLPATVFTQNFTFGREFDSFDCLHEVIENPENWHCMFVGSGKKCNLCNLYVGKF